jgi:hypothetical protein
MYVKCIARELTLTTLTKWSSSEVPKFSLTVGTKFVHPCFSFCSLPHPFFRFSVIPLSHNAAATWSHDHMITWSHNRRSVVPPYPPALRVAVCKEQSGSRAVLFCAVLCCAVLCCRLAGSSLAPSSNDQHPSLQQCLPPSIVCQTQHK